MGRVHSYLGLAAASLGLTACISSPEQLDDPTELPSAGEDEFDALFFDAQLKLRCPQTDKRYTPGPDPSGQTIAIQLARSDEYFGL